METWSVTVAAQHTGLQDQGRRDPCVHQGESSGSRVLAVGPVLLACFLQPSARDGVLFSKREPDRSSRSVRQQWAPKAEVCHQAHSRMKPRSEGGAMSGWGFGSIPSLEEGET